MLNKVRPQPQRGNTKVLVFRWMLFLLLKIGAMSFKVIMSNNPQNITKNSFCGN